MMVLFKKPVFWIGLIIVLIIVLLILVFEPKLANTPENYQSSSQKLSQKPKSSSKPGTCLVLEQKYCRQGQFTEWKDSDGNVTKLVVLNLPKNTPIFSPFDGQFTGTNGGNPINPNLPSIEVYDENSSKKTDFVLIGNIKIRDGLNIGHDNVKKGDILAYTTDAVDKILSGNLALTFDSFDPEKGTRGTDETMLLLFLSK